MAMQQWDEHLGTLQVQRKFSDIVALERESRSWKKIMNNGLMHLWSAIFSTQSRVRHPPYTDEPPQNEDPTRFSLSTVQGS